MARLSNVRIRQEFGRSDASIVSTDKGRILEDLTCYIFGKVPGISVTERNTLNAFASEEIDVAFWNERIPNGLEFLPHIILVECKNWTNAVGSIDVNWFDTKVANRGLDFGILIAANGITGNPADMNRSHQIISVSLREKRKIIVISRRELEQLNTTNELCTLIKQKLCKLAVAGTIF